MRTIWLAALLSCGLHVGCNRALTAAEARAALDESSLESQASAVAASTIEINTDFTIGAAVEDAAAELRAFVQSQVPCAEIALSGNRLTIEYGANGTCAFHGRAFSGTHTVTVARNSDADVLVQHSWNDVSNGIVSVTGAADVTWSATDRSRRVVHDLTWTRLSDQRTGDGSGDRIQTLLPGGLSEGIVIDGDRHWRGESGDWSLEIDQIEVRFRDPVPQAGRYVLDTPFDKTASLAFDRVDSDSIAVTVSSGRRSFSFQVNALGGVTAR